jgi:ABC-2 type transport system ATP-binding protein
MPAPMIEARGLGKRFGARAALNELTFTADQGEIVGLLGPNGAGKTTAIRLLTTMLTPSRGDFSVAGRPSTRPNEIRRLIGVLPEGAGYPAQQTGRSYLRYYAGLFGLTRAAGERVAEQLLRDMDLVERASSPISTYSRGMRQRLGIARALVNAPAVVFLDEPTLGLDPAGQHKVLAIVREMAKVRGVTVVLSTHMLAEVEHVCTSVRILNRGTVVTAGSVAEVIRRVAVPRSGRLRVPPEFAARARMAIATVDGVDVDVGDPTGLVTVTVTAAAEQTDRLLNAALMAVLRADVPVHSFEMDGSRLADAFLALTTGGAR